MGFDLARVSRSLRQTSATALRVSIVSHLLILSYIAFKPPSMANGVVTALVDTTVTLVASIAQVGLSFGVHPLTAMATDTRTYLTAFLLQAMFAWGATWGKTPGEFDVGLSSTSFFLYASLAAFGAGLGATVRWATGVAALALLVQVGDYAVCPFAVACPNVTRVQDVGRSTDIVVVVGKSVMAGAFSELMGGS